MQVKYTKGNIFGGLESSLFRTIQIAAINFHLEKIRYDPKDSEKIAPKERIKLLMEL